MSDSKTSPIVKLTPSAKISLPPEKVNDAVEAGDQFFEFIVKVASPTGSGFSNCFLDTSLNLMLYDPPVFNAGVPGSNLSTMWILEKVDGGTSGGDEQPLALGPWKISNSVTTHANQDGHQIAYLNTGENMIMSVQGIQILPIKVQGNVAQFYLEAKQDPYVNFLYAIYTKPFMASPDKRAYLLPFFDNTMQTGSRAKQVSAFIDGSSDPHVFMLRTVPKSLIFDELVKKQS